MKVLFIINVKSGSGLGETLHQLLEEEAKSAEFDFQTYEMNCKPGEDEENIRQKIEAYSPEIVAAAGGDGTVNFLASLLSGTSLSLAIIPCGSANGMARELGIGNDLKEALKLLSQGDTRKIDILLINDQPSIHLADVGLNASIVKRFDQDTKRGIRTYAKHLFTELFLLKTYKFRIEADGQKFKKRAVSLTFANASKYGTGAIINATGKLDDGCFELVIVKPFPKIKVFNIAWKMFRGTLQTSEYVEVIHCHEAHIRSQKAITLQNDGEVIGKVKDIHIKISPQALSVIVPHDFSSKV
jgi:diacylglycerol kinase (ATP)